MRVLIACEFSGIVREEFNKLGHDSWSCDLLPTEIPGKHIQGDLFGWLELDWDLVIAHPPCTALAVSGNRYYSNSKARKDAIEFVENIWFSNYKGKLCIENPVGVLSTQSKIPVKPQYIQPYYFGHPESKKTGLWLRDLPNLVSTNILSIPDSGRWENQTSGGQNNISPSKDRWKLRSKTYAGIAVAMANQWGK